jgi:phage shock protein A
MLDRFKNVVKGMLNQGVSKLETPEILAEQAQMEIESGLKKTKEAVTAALTNEKMLGTQLQKAKDELSTWEKRAVMAIEQNNDDLARQCLARKKELTELTATLETQVSEQQKSTAALKQRLKELEDEYGKFKIQKQSMLARAQAAQGVAKANELISGKGGAGGNTMDKWEEKIRDKENRNEALKEMAGLDGGSVDKQLTDSARNLDIDDELAALKSKMTTPKLVETSDEAANANVPLLKSNKAESDIAEAEVVSEDDPKQ